MAARKKPLKVKPLKFPKNFPPGGMTRADAIGSHEAARNQYRDLVGDPKPKLNLKNVVKPKQTAGKAFKKAGPKASIRGGLVKKAVGKAAVKTVGKVAARGLPIVGTLMLANDVHAAISSIKKKAATYPKGSVRKRTATGRSARGRGGRR
jgi:hypothetical protein